MDSLDLLLVVTKCLGILFGGSFAILGLLTDFRDKNTNRVTKWGRIALIGIAASTCVSLISQGVESIKAKDDASAQAQRSNKLLTQIARSVSPLRDIQINYQIEVPLNDPVLASYRQRLLDGMNQIASTPPGSESPLGSASRGPNGVVEWILIPWSSPLMPTDNDVAASALLKHSGISLYFYKTPIDSDAFIRLATQFAPGPRPSPDLSMVVKDENPPPISGNSIPDQLVYDFQNKVLRVSTRQLLSASSFSTSRMVSVPDLCESQLWVTLFNISPGYPIDPLSHQMHLRSLSIEVGSRPFIIQDFKEYQTGNLGFFSVFTFPKTEEALDALTPKYP
jgi:hypothetical protein